MGVKPHTKAVKQDVCSQFLKVRQLSHVFKKRAAILRRKSGKPNINWMSKTFQRKLCLESIVAADGETRTRNPWITNPVL